MRRAFLLALVIGLNVSLPLLIVEWSYRIQVVDTYSPELRTFNAPQVLADDGRPTLLLMGDSFTASPTSYAGILQETLREWRVINAAISGTGVVQACYIAPRRFARFRPAIFLYQVYVGNDLFDVRYPTNWRAVSLARNLYWVVANHLRVASYLNYRLRQVWAAFSLGPQHAGALSSAPAVALAAAPTETPAVAPYDARVALSMRAEPSLLEDSILLQGRRRQDYAVFLQGVERLLAHCTPEACRAYILVVPHACQVDETRLAQMRHLGARFADPEALRMAEYPFLHGLRERLAARHHVQVLNPLPALREAGARQAVYYAHDDHLTPAGQQAIAAFLVQQLALR